MSVEHWDLTQRIIGCAQRVYNTLGPGFLESIYERCFLIELYRAGLHAEEQVPIHVYYEEEFVGEFIADVFVEETVIVELKAVRSIAPIHEVQLVNYLAATGKPVGLLINFGESGIEVRRRVKQLKPKDTEQV